MMNRLPKTFRLPTANGSAVQQAHPTIAADIPHRIMDQAARCIGRYPVASLGAAFVVGIVLGRVIKR